MLVKRYKEKGGLIGSRAVLSSAKSLVIVLRMVTCLMVDCKRVIMNNPRFKGVFKLSSVIQAIPRNVSSDKKVFRAHPEW